MSAEADTRTPAEILAAAEAYYAHQVERLAQRHGARWSALEGWLRAYLREEIRQRLIARGWRPRR